MKKNKLGHFYIDNTIIAIDPCYDEKKDGLNIDLLHGKYVAHTIAGRLKNPFCGYDTLKECFRNSQLHIINEEYIDKELKYEAIGDFLSVDSGQFGFFDINNYRKDYKEEIPLEGNRYDFFENSYLNALLNEQKYNKALEEKEKNKLFKRMLEAKISKRKRTKEEIIKYFKLQLEFTQMEIEDNKKIRKTKEYPSFYDLKESREFYEIIMHLTCGEFHAGVFPHYGVVSRTGLGDGGYQIYAAKNNKGENIALYVEFLSKERII